MKTLVVAINALWLVAGAVVLGGAEGHSIFVDHDDLIPSQADGSGKLSPADLEKVRTRPEFLPAEQDPTGNWGEPSRGVQMGLRLPAASFATGSGIDAAIIVRNIGSVPLSYAIGAPLELFLAPAITLGDGGQIIPRLAEARATNDFQRRMARMLHNPKLFHLAPGTQRKHQMRLTDAYDLSKAGKYALNISLQLDSPAGGSFTASTATAALIVTNNSIANTNLPYDTSNQDKSRSGSGPDLSPSPVNSAPAPDSAPPDASAPIGPETQKSPSNPGDQNTPSSNVTGRSLFVMTALLTLLLLAWGWRAYIRKA